MQPIPYPAVNIVLNRLLSESQGILQERFVGMYLYGSLASGDFNTESSDIDFVVITSEALPDEIVRALEAMYTGIIGSGLKWANKLEGAFVPQWVIRRHAEAGPAVPTVNEGKFYEAPLGNDWVIQRHIIREHSTPLAGPVPASLIDPVLPDEIRASVQGVLDEWWWPMIDNPGFIRRPEYQAFAVLTMCRVMHALDHGTIVSKQVAAGWAQTVVEPNWRGLIQWAMAWNHDDTTDQFDYTVAFMQYVRDWLQAI
jgi:Domain of unknown function (DUF4111)/Nucleotidyltransferase domain